MVNSETVTLTTDELRRLIREEVQLAIEGLATLDDVDARIAHALNNRPTLRDVNTLIQAEIDATIDRTFAPMLETVQKGFKTFDARFASLEKHMAQLIERSENQSAAMSDIKRDHDRIDTEQDRVQQEVADLRADKVKQAGEITSLEHAIFGDPARQGTGSLYDHISNLGKTLAEQMGQQGKVTQDALKGLTAQITQAETQVATMKEMVKANTRFRQRRQRIESAIVQGVPKVVKRIGEAATHDWVVKWAVRIGIGGGSLVIAGLLEMLRS